QRASGAIRRPYVAALEPRRLAMRRPAKLIAIAIQQAGDVAERAALVHRAHQLAERHIAFAAHDRIDTEVRMRPRLGRQARIVPANDDAHVGLERSNECNYAAGGGALE